MCCSFNLAKADEMFHNETFATNIRRMQTKDASKAFDKKLPSLKQIGQRGAEEIASIKPLPGIAKGLRVILDSHSDIVSTGSLNKDGQGFTAIIGSRYMTWVTSLQNWLNWLSVLIYSFLHPAEPTNCPMGAILNSPFY